jgi:type IV secretion system protein VirB1
MSALSIAAVTLLAAQCQQLVSPMTVVGIAQHESALDPTRIHQNADGSRDYGLMQINERNFGWLGLTEQTALDPCHSIAAGAAVLTALSRYNSGSSTKSLPYALAVSARIDALRRPLPQGAWIETARIDAIKGAPAIPLPNPGATEGDDDIEDRPALLTERSN